MHQQKTPREPGKTGQTDVETGKPQDMRDRRMPGEGGAQHSQQGERSGQQGAAPSTTQQDKTQHKQEQHATSKQQGRHDTTATPGGKPQHQQDMRDTTKQQGSHESKQQGSHDATTQGGKKPGQQSQSGTADNVHGEGNYAASRDYNERTKQFVDSGRVEQAAKDAAPRDQAEARDMRDAEKEGRSHTKGEDPAVKSDKAHKPGSGPDE